jgi:hypothetical protein
MVALSVADSALAGCLAGGGLDGKLRAWHSPDAAQTLNVRPTQLGVKDGAKVLLIGSR